MMKEIETIQYEAFDGTIFEEEDECLEYEAANLFSAYADDVQFMTSDGTMCDTLQQLENDGVICVIFDHEYAEELFDIIRNNWSVDVPGNGYGQRSYASNTWVYDGDQYEWAPVDHYKEWFETLGRAFEFSEECKRRIK